MDIVERLRLVDSSIWLSSGLADDGRLMVGEWSHEAANEIERLREALKQITQKTLSDESWLSRSVDIRVIAHEALMVNE